MTNMFRFVLMLAVLAVSMAFAPMGRSVNRIASLKMQTPSFYLAELFSGPAAKYNGELIQPGLKLIQAAPKPADYDYGAVDMSSGGPVLAASAIAVVLVAAAVPYFLSIGESAQTQQREREASDKSNPNNKFVAGNKGAVRAAITKTGVVVGDKKKAGVASKLASKAAPASKATSKSASKPAAIKSTPASSFSFVKLVSGKNPLLPSL